MVTNNIVYPCQGMVNDIILASKDVEAQTPYWKDEKWVPRTKSGKQKSPNIIRGELQRYIDSSPLTQTAIIEQMGVNSNSFRRFMNPKNYKDQWSALQNGTYWSAARMLERIKYENSSCSKTTSGATGKRKFSGDGDIATSIATAPKRSKAEKDDFLNQILAIKGVKCYEDSTDSYVYDSCQDVIKKLKQFLTQEGFSKVTVCHALGNLNSNSLRQFMLSKKQDGAGMVAYVRVYEFLEKLRILEGMPKSAKRFKNEAEHPTGFSTRKITGRTTLKLEGNAA